MDRLWPARGESVCFKVYRMHAVEGFLHQNEPGGQYTYDENGNDERKKIEIKKKEGKFENRTVVRWCATELGEGRTTRYVGLRQTQVAQVCTQDELHGTGPCREVGPIQIIEKAGVTLKNRF